MKTLISILVCSFMASITLQGQTSPFDIGIYKEFKKTHDDIPASELFELYPSEVFKKSVPEFDTATVLYLDEMDRTYELTPYEKSLLMNNGFVVSERLQEGSYSSSKMIT